MTDGMYAELDEFMANGWPCLVVAQKDETGKNTLLANWLESSAVNAGKKVIYHCIGGGNREEDYRKVLDRLCDRITDLYSLKRSDGDSLGANNPRKQLEELLKEIYAKEPLVIVLDGADRIGYNGNHDIFRWLPFPTKKVKYIFGTYSGHAMMDIFRRRGYPICCLDSNNAEIVSEHGNIEEDRWSEQELTAYNYYSENNPDKLYETICRFDVFELLYDNDIYQLSKYWKLLLDADKLRFSPLKHMGCGDVGRQGTILRKLARFFNAYCPNMEAAMHFAEQSLKYALEKYGEDHRETLRRYDDIGDVYYNFAKYYDAWEYYNKVLDKRREVLGEEDPDTAVSYYKMGDVEQDINSEDQISSIEDHTEIEYYEKALDIRRKVLGEKHPVTINTYENIGRYYLGLVDYSDLEMGCYSDNDFMAGFTGVGYLKAALDMKMKIYGEQHPYVADLYSGIARSEFFAGRDLTSPRQHSLAYYEKAIKVQEAVLGECHPDTAHSYIKAAVIHAGYHRFGKAAEYTEKYLMYSNRYDDMNLSGTAKRYDDLGLYYIHAGNYSRALDSAEKALDISRKIYKEGDRQLAIPYYNVGVVYDFMDNHSLAMEHFRKAYQLADDFYWTYYTSLIRSCDFEGDGAKAEEYREKEDTIKCEVMNGVEPE